MPDTVALASALVAAADRRTEPPRVASGSPRRSAGVTQAEGFTLAGTGGDGAAERGGAGAPPPGFRSAGFGRDHRVRVGEQTGTDGRVGGNIRGGFRVP